MAKIISGGNILKKTTDQDKNLRILNSKNLIDGTIKLTKSMAQLFET